LLIFRQKLTELGIHIPEEELNDFAAFMKGYIAIDSKKYKQYKELLKLIEQANKVRKIYPHKEFRACLLYDRLRLWKFYYKTGRLLRVSFFKSFQFRTLFNFKIDPEPTFQNDLNPSKNSVPVGKSIKGDSDRTSGNCCLALVGVMGQLLRNFDCWRMLLSNF